jgi:hypothetical protein
MYGGKLHRFTGVRIGASMITFADGRRHAKDGRGTDGYYASEREAAEAMISPARWTLNYHREKVRAYESMVADCERVLAAAPRQDGAEGVG